MNARHHAVLRTRWAATGAAIAVVLGAGGIGLATASSSTGDQPVTVFLDEPCRLRDTRPDRGIGGRTGPLGPGEAYTVQGTGPSGNCDVPADAVGLVTNVTADQATQNTNLRLYPTGGTVPTTSNLNPRPGTAPTPNAVTVGLDGSGRFDIRNAKGNVHVIIDVVAYLTDHEHDDRYYTKTQVNALLADKADRPTGASSIVLPAAAFTLQQSSDLSLTYDHNYLDWTSTGHPDYGDCVVAPVHLPAGVTMTSFGVGFYFDVSGDTIAADLLAVGFQSGSLANSIATVVDGDGAGYDVGSDTTITTPTVDPLTHYAVRVCLTGAAEFEYAEIEFTYPA